MTPPLVLVSSASLGPACWISVARIALASGVDCVVPDLTHLTDLGPPYWPRMVDVVADAMGQLDDAGPVLLVLHSNTGRFAPVLVQGSARPVAGVLFVDAALPAEPGPTPGVPADLLGVLEALADRDGRLPPWSQWRPASVIERMLPEAEVRQRVLADQPRLPLDFLREPVPTPPGWTAVARGYLRFSDAYAAEHERALGAGWPALHLPGGHLHQVVDPLAVFDAIRELARLLVGSAGTPG